VARLSRIAPLEQLGPAFLLRIARVQHLPPFRAGRVGIVKPLGDDALQIEVAHGLERGDAVAGHRLASCIAYRRTMLASIARRSFSGVALTSSPCATRTSNAT